MIRVELPYIGSVLSVNHAYKRGPNGRVYLATEAAKWKAALRNEIRSAAGRDFPARVIEPIIVRVSGCFKDNRSACDLDNLAKLVLDGVAAGLSLPNDKNLRFQAGERIIGDPDPHIVVEVMT